MPEAADRRKLRVVLGGLASGLAGPVAERLRGRGFQVSPVATVEKALQSTGKDTPAVVVLAPGSAVGAGLALSLDSLSTFHQVILILDESALPKAGSLGERPNVQLVLLASDPILSAGLLLQAVLKAAAIQESAHPPRPSGYTEGNPVLDLESRNRLLREQLERKDVEMRTVIDACEKITSSLQVEEVLRFIQDSARRLMRAESSSVILLDSSGDFLHIASSTGAKEEQVKGLRFPSDKGIAGWVFRHGRPLIVNDIERDGRFYPEIDQLTGFHTRSIACAPLILRGKIIGVVEVLNHGENAGFHEDRLELFTTFVNLAAIALDNARSYDTLSQDYQLLLNEQMRHEGLYQSENETMKRVYELCRHVAPFESTVLLQGDSGTGKELLADLVHRLSNRRDKPLVKVNIAALPENLVESELFGHEKGSFTGAVARAVGKFEQADRGTIFLDEIGELRPDTQVKLLRFLQEHTFERIGGNETIRVDVRIIAATNKDLRQAVNEGAFRKDLYYRLNVVPVFIPLLHDRYEDIPLLVEFFIHKFNLELNRKVTGVSREALELLTAYPWPGNIRELENIVERILVMKPAGVIQVEDIPSEIANPPAASNDSPAGGGLHSRVEPRKMWDVERDMIEKTLRDNSFNQSRTARKLGITLNQLRYRIGKFRIDLPR